MLLTGDYHTHTPYSHGKHTVAENVSRAKEVGLKEIAITDHGFSHVVYGLRRKEVAAYREECRAAEEQYGVKVLVGMEANIQGRSGKVDMREKDYENFDIFLCGYHIVIYYETLAQSLSYGFGNLLLNSILRKTTKTQLTKNTLAYINAIKKNPIDILTHVNFQCPCHSLEVAKCAADYGTYIELNAKKNHFTDEELCEMVQKTDVRFVINSDAHSMGRVGDTKLVEEQLKRIAFPLERIDNIDGRRPVFRFSEYKKTH